MARTAKSEIYLGNAGEGERGSHASGRLSATTFQACLNKIYSLSHEMAFKEQPLGSRGAALTEELYIRFVALLAAAMLVPTVVFVALAISHPDMRFWRVSASAMSALFTASLLSALRDIIPPVPSILSANILVGVGYFLALTSVRCLKGNPVGKVEDLLLLGLFVSLALFVNFTANTYDNRVIVISGGIVMFSVAIVHYLLSIRRGLSALGLHITISASVLNICLAAARGMSAWLDSEIYFLSLAFWDPVFFIGLIAIVFGVSLGFFIMGSSIIAARTEAQLSTERELTQQLNAAIDDQRNLQKLLLHEIKRPINALTAALQVQGSDPDGLGIANDPRDLLHIANEAGAFLEAIGEYDELSSLFDTPSKVPLSITSVIEDLRSKWQINIHTDLTGTNPTIIADPLLIDIAFGNLIENAQNFSRTKTKITVHIHADTTNIIFDVEDDGPGIPTDQWTKVWRKFYRIGEASQNAVKGCGLGLHAVSCIAKAHDGYAAVVSQVPSRLRFAIGKKKEDV